MKFKEAIQLLSNKISKLKGSVLTKEATKNAFVLPLIQTLGYDVFNPLEVVPEFTSNIANANKDDKEKIDYAIVQDGVPNIIIRCSHWQESLLIKDDFLANEFNKSRAKFGIRTNGYMYKFYTDLIEVGKMDEIPFFEIDLLKIKSDKELTDLAKFHKSLFNPNNILDTAVNDKYIGKLKEAIHKELNDPSPDLVKLLVKYIYKGTVTKKVQEQFGGLVKRSIATYMSEMTGTSISATAPSSNSPATAIQNDQFLEKLVEKEAGENSQPIQQEEIVVSPVQTIEQPELPKAEIVEMPPKQEAPKPSTPVAVAQPTATAQTTASQLVQTKPAATPPPSITKTARQAQQATTTVPPPPIPTSAQTAQAQISAYRHRRRRRHLH